MHEEKFYIPKYLDELPRWLFWTLDEAAALLAPFILGILLFNQTLLEFITGIISMILISA